VLVLAAGCAGGPPGPDPFSGRLAGAAASARQAGDASGVVPASASEPVFPQRAVSRADSTAVSKPDDDDGFDWSDLSPDNVVKNAKKAVGLGPNEELARSRFQEGRALFEQQKYSEAAEKFESAAGRWPDSVLEEDALFWQGESYFFSDRYSKAQDASDNLLKKYDNSRHLDTVVKRLFSIGRYWG
jgi:TolA-binding protein